MSVLKGISTNFFITSEDSLHKLTNNCVRLYSEESKQKITTSLSSEDFSDNAKNAGIVGYGYKIQDLTYYFESEESLVKFQMKYL